MYFGIDFVFFAWLLSSIYVVRVHSSYREFHITKTSGDQCQTFEVGEPWRSVSVTECFVQCLLRYPGTCQSIFYNTQTNMCTPGSVSFRPLSFITTSHPAVGSSDTLYFLEKPLPPCQVGSTFAHYKICGFTLCLHLSSVTATYAQARTNCDSLGSRLFVADTVARLSMFWHWSLDTFNYPTWLGMTDADVEGTFVWENGQPLSNETAQLIWHPGQPDNNNDNSEEDCVEARHASGYNQGISDNGCNYYKYYICEPYDAYVA